MNYSAAGFFSATFLSSTTATATTVTVSGADDTDDGTVDEWSESCEDCVVIVNIAQAVPLVGHRGPLPFSRERERWIVQMKRKRRNSLSLYSNLDNASFLS